MSRDMIFLRINGGPGWPKDYFRKREERPLSEREAAIEALEAKLERLHLPTSWAPKLWKRGVKSRTCKDLWNELESIQRQLESLSIRKKELLTPNQEREAKDVDLQRVQRVE